MALLFYIVYNYLGATQTQICVIGGYSNKKKKQTNKCKNKWKHLISVKNNLLLRVSHFLFLLMKGRKTAVPNESSSMSH